MENRTKYLIASTVQWFLHLVYHQGVSRAFKELLELSTNCTMAWVAER